MRGLRWIAAGLVVLLLVGAFVAVWRFPAWRGLTRSAKTDQTHRNDQSGLELVAMPDVGLQIDGENELVAYQGIPLILTVRLANQRAMNAALENQASEAYLKALEAKPPHGGISEEKREAKISQLRHKAEVLAVQVGDESVEWEQFVHIAQQLPDGKIETMSWPLKLASAPQRKALLLDAENTAQMDFLMDPTSAAQIAPGAYNVVAVLEVTDQAVVPANYWRGRVQSEPVKLTILTKPAKLALNEEERMNIQIGRYYQAANDPKRALQAAESALSVNSHSIRARVMQGELKEAQGDLKGALEAYQSGLAEFYKQHPNSYEGPQYLILKTSDLFAKLRNQALQHDQPPKP